MKGKGRGKKKGGGGSKGREAGKWEWEREGGKVEDKLKGDLRGKGGEGEREERCTMG